MKCSLRLSIVTILFAACALGFCPAAQSADNPVVCDESVLAKHLIGKAGISRGICSILGSDDGELAIALAGAGDFYVHMQDPRASAVEAAKEMVNAKGLYGKQIIVETGSLQQLPYADNIVDFIIATDLEARDLKDLSIPEMLRVLRPEGVAILGRQKKAQDSDQDLTKKDLKNWLKEVDVKDTSIDSDDLGVWAQVTKPALEGADDWSHWEHGPDNNPVSIDAVIKAPYMTQWLGNPLYIAMPAITTAAGGRTFIAMGHIAHHVREEPWLNTLLARNGYNGTILWKMKLPDGYLAHRSAFIATDDTFYMIDPGGSGCMLLDPETGEEKDRIFTPEVSGEWKWIALKDGVLYALAGKKKDPPETTIVRSTYTHWSWGELSKGYYEKRVPWGFGETILAYDLDKKKLLWTHEENAPVDSRAMAMGGGQIFFYGPDSHIGCLDERSGELIWANDDPKTRELIEEEGRGLSSTPGFRTCCYSLYTPDALFYEAQTRMNVVAVSKEDGHLLWHRTKTSNNPNMLYTEGQLYVGVGPNGSTLVVNPLTGATIKDLDFAKRSCARLTATPDSLFCRGMPEGMTRYDRATGKVQFNGAFRPACNDGVIGANGILYAGPWACDCNLSLMGRVAMCSAGDFDFERKATNASRLQLGYGDISRIVPLDTSAKDWPTYRGNNARSASSKAAVAEETSRIWEFRPKNVNAPTAATASGGFVFLCGDDGIIRALDAATGALEWSFFTAGPILQPPTIWNGRAYVGSGDGYVYALEAATGRLLWRFRGAPVERRIMVYGSLCSTWPVNSGVLVEDGVVYASAGIIDYDGTYVYALDAITGEILWENNTSGHLDKELRKGISAQGILTAAGGRLWMAGGNVVSPAIYDLRTGEYQAGPPGDGSPRSNRGEEVGVFDDKYVMLGGRLRYSATTNVVDPGQFETLAVANPSATLPVNTGKIPPAWDSERIAFVNGMYTKPVCYTSASFKEYLDTGDPRKPPMPAWSAQTPGDRDTISVALVSNAVLTVGQSMLPRQLKTVTTVSAFDPDDGSVLWQNILPSPAIPGGLLVDRNGRVLVVMADGSVTCFAGDNGLEAYLDSVNKTAKKGDEGREKALVLLNNALQQVNTLDGRDLLIANIEKLGGKPGHIAETKGCVTRWKVIGSVPWDYGRNHVDKVFVDEPDVDVTKSYDIDGQTIKWRNYYTVHSDGMVDLERIYGSDANLAAYGYAEVTLPKDQELLLKIGTNDGYKGWFNGEEVGRFDAGRGWGPDQDSLRIKAKKGVNKILLKVTQHGSAWAFSARLTDLEGNPLDLIHAQ
ncbi:MAG: PQQ-binding-like beta-propeller repeat protein [bacterium]